MSYRATGMRNPFGFVLTPWVKRLLMANGVVYLLTLAFRGLIPYLGFTPALVLSQPWTPLTYMFVHASFFHLFFNMLGLFFFGPPLEERWGSREFIKFYLIAGLGGALLSLVFWNSMVVGASGAIYGVLLAYALYWPDNPIYIYGILPVKAKWLVTFYIGLSLFYALFGGASNVAHLAHLGGCAAGFLYLKSAFGPSPWGPRVATRKRSASAAVPAPENAWRGDARAAKPAAKPVSTRREGEALDEVDRILDKISSRGLASLTDDERRKLDEVSRRFRTN